MKEAQRLYLDSHHHPSEKINQINKILNNIKLNEYKILETFAGQGNLTNIYNSFNPIKFTPLTLPKFKDLNKHFVITKDSKKEIFKLIADDYKYNIIDIDGYGPEGLLLQNIFYLFDNNIGSTNILFWTFGTLTSGSQATKIKKFKYKNIFNNENPTYDDFISTLNTYANQHYFKTKVLDKITFNMNNNAKIYRIAVECKRENAFKIVGQTVPGRKKKNDKTTN